MFTYFLYHFVIIFNHFIIFYVVVMNGIFMLQMFVSLFDTAMYMIKTRHYEYRLMGQSTNMIPISLLVPAYNEEMNIVESIKSFLNLDYLNYEIIVINDGSKDNTLKTVIDAFGLQKVSDPVRMRLTTREVRGIYYNPELPRLRLIDKENGGKSDALNAGLNLSRYPYFVSVDADSFLKSNALLCIAMAFIKNKHTVAVGGIVRLINGCRVEEGKLVNAGIPKKIWEKFQTLEYLRSFLVGRIGWNHFNSLLIISGALGAFQKEPVLQVNGYTTGTIGEDMDLVVKLHRYMINKKYKYKVAFLPDPICWTQAPATLKTLFRQRRRWHIGLIDVISRNRDIFFNPRYGVVGIFSIPFHFLFEEMAPIVEVLGYIMIPLAWYFGLLSTEMFVLFLIASIFFGVITSIGSLAVEDLTTASYIRVRELLFMVFLSFVENIFYRQMTVGFRLVGIFSSRKYRQTWGIMKRQKLNQDSDEKNGR